MPVLRGGTLSAAELECVEVLEQAMYERETRRDSSYKGRAIRGFTFCGVHYYVTIWKELLQLLSGILYNLDPRIFEDSISPMRGNSRRYFHQDPEGVRMRSPRRVGRSGWYVETHWDNDKTYLLCVEMLQRFGYGENDLELDVV